MKITAPAILLATLSACTFSLGTVQPQAGVSKSAMQLDIAVCRDFAFKYAGTPDKQVGAFLLGLTVVGFPVAHEIDKADQRHAFSVCMEEKGYVVVPPAEASR